jgi:hypothetical protein
MICLTVSHPLSSQQRFIPTLGDSKIKILYECGYMPLKYQTILENIQQVASKLFDVFIVHFQT